MMKKLMMIVLISFVALAMAEEFPYISGDQFSPKNVPVNIDRGDQRFNVPEYPLWMGLKRMNLSERANSQIDITLGSDTSAQAQQMAMQIKSLWNNGQFSEALDLFQALGKITDLNKASISNSWRTPVPTVNGNRWGTDVRIGNRDSILTVNFDIHRASGNLFAIFLLEGDGTTNKWTVNFSTDGGQTWAETFEWFATYQINSVSAAVAESHCYVGYTSGSDQIDARLRQFKVTDGSSESFSNGSSYLTVFSVTAPNSLKEITISTNQDLYNNRVYYTAITGNGEIKHYWAAIEPLNWSEITTSVTHADRGLDVSYNETVQSDKYLWISYFSTGDSIHIDAVDVIDTWNPMIKYPVGTYTQISSISSYRDTVTCFFDYHGNNLHCRYLVSYTGASSWFWGFVDDTSTTQESPAVTGRNGGGVGVVYRFYTSPREERFNWRNYSGGWATPASLADVAPYWNRPAIEYLDNNKFGVVYLSWSSPVVRGAFFDRSDWPVGINNPDPQLGIAVKDFQLLQNYPNPFNPVTEISYVLPRQEDVVLEVYNSVGQKVVTLVDGKQSAGHKSVRWNASNFASGVYYYKLKVADKEKIRKMILMK